MRLEDFEGACALEAELQQLAAQPAQTAALLLETQRLQAFGSSLYPKSHNRRAKAKQKGKVNAKR